jgi:hypothetical protein
MREAARTTGHLLRSAPGAPPINKGDTVKVRLNDWLNQGRQIQETPWRGQESVYDFEAAVEQLHKIVPD